MRENGEPLRRVYQPCIETLHRQLREDIVQVHSNSEGLACNHDSLCDKGVSHLSLEIATSMSQPATVVGLIQMLEVSSTPEAKIDAYMGRAFDLLRWVAYNVTVNQFLRDDSLSEDADVELERNLDRFISVFISDLRKGNAEMCEFQHVAFPC